MRENNEMETLWRLLDESDQNTSGAWNMAIDEALLRVAGEEAAAPPILRFYDWDPPCLSLGRFQRTESLQLEPSVSYVRRPTGGRAVWHEHEITYSVVLREELLPCDARSVVASYRWISEGFLRGLQTLGVSARIGDEKVAQADASTQTKERDSNTNCFDSATRADFVVDGRKILGAAQCRENGVILQHGSLLLDVDEELWRRHAGGSLRDVVTLRALGIDATQDEIKVVLVRGMSETAGARFQNSLLSAREHTVAKTLLLKYESSRWNNEAKFSLDDADRTLHL